jgi:hypothetical protein
VIIRAAKSAGSLFVSMIFLYVFFFVPIGRRTLWDHAKRIAGTAEAQEFGHEMRGAGERVVEQTEHEIRNGIAVANARDGGSFIPEAPATPPRRAHPR